MPEHIRSVNLDANESVFFARQLEHIKAQTYDRKFPDYKAFDLLPVSMEAAPGSQSITYQAMSGVGLARIIHSYGDDLPRSDVFGREETVRVKGLGTHYQYDIQEIRAAQMAGRSLQQRQAMMARRAIDEQMNRLAWFGDAEHGLQGLFDFPNIGEYLTPNGDSGDSEWTDKTPDEIYADMAGMYTKPLVDTNGVERIDTLLLSIDRYRIASSTRMADGTDTTILQFFQQNHPDVTVDWLFELAEAGDGGSHRAIGYRADAEHLTMEIPQPFEQFPAQERNLAFIVPCHARFGGVIVYYPLSVVFADNI